MYEHILLHTKDCLIMTAIDACYNKVYDAIGHKLVIFLASWPGEWPE